MPVRLFNIPFLLILPVAFLFSCSGSPKKNDEAALVMLKESLGHSNELISGQTKNLFEAFRDRLGDPSFGEHSGTWFPKVLLIRDSTERINSQINLLADALESGKNTPAESDYLLLYEKLSQYSKMLLHTDSGITADLKPYIDKNLPTTGLSATAFYGKYFRQHSNNASAAILTCFKNGIARVENKLVEYCYAKTHIIIDDFSSYKILVGINSRIVQQGDEIEINAGMGEFTVRSNPQITIKDQIIPINPSGIAIYKFKAAGAPGRYAVPVKIKYINERGEQITEMKNVEYTIRD